MPPALTPQAFVAKWRNNTRKERSAAQEHFIDLCRLVGHPTPGEAASSNTYDFEAGASKQTGGSGWADVWKKGYFAWEYKGKHADLAKAYQQLLQYRESLENPPLLVVSDLDTIEIHTNFTNTVKQIYRLTLDDVLTLAGQQRLRNVFFEPEVFRAPQTTQQVTEAAAQEFARLADLLRRWKEDPHQIAHFLIRLLFCLFAEDIGLLPKDLFSKLIQSTHMRPQVFTQQLRLLFGQMATGGWFGAEEIPYFNGRLFDNDAVLDLDSEGMDILAQVSQLDWSSIEPSILGTLFERSLDPDKRSQLGAHYTNKDDILLIVEPVLMAPLRQKWADIKTRAQELTTRRATVATAQRTRIDNELRTLLTGFSHELSQVRVLDPACGSGNFLYVSLKQLLDLEKEVITTAGDLELGLFFPSVSPEQLRGIELNAYAHELAQITVWIGYIQWLRDNGFGQPSEPILKPLDTIVHMDAVLTFDVQEQPVEPDWPEADVIIGNPPFVGGNRVRQGLGNHYVDALFKLYEGRVPAFADFVCYWLEHARSLIEADKAHRVGFVTTNSIRGGVNRKVLERIKQSGNIFMAWSDRPWKPKERGHAAVRVAMVGFDNGAEQTRMLNGLSVTKINTDLTADLDLTQAKRLTENLSIAFEGTKKGAKFDIGETLAVPMLQAPLNPNGRPNSDVVKPWMSGHEVNKRPRRVWIIDFGVDMEREEAALYESPFAYVEKHIKPKYAASRKKWWLHERTRPDMRAALAQCSRFIATVRHSKYRSFMWAETTFLPDSALVVFARDDDYFFGVLHSKLHQLWSLRMCTWLGVGNDPRYTPTTTFETFPFPWPPNSEPAGNSHVIAIATASRELVEKRDRWLNPDGASEADLKKRTLTNLYKERPTWLDVAHLKLDQAVLDAYGWPHDLSDDEILSRLLTLNLERAAKHGSEPTVHVNVEVEEETEEDE